ncbi:solute carrier family 2, facilitated glucose transporter member 1 isoform X2 [Lepeophtheirus salmonis]|uniref:solute carrier family 2, facilitated glucose transporter member 1 isoform X2 n=2 Tax=Lepeophtheirus salmonis TaxID=72036 RepID=UPI001AE3E5F6|nr:glucose transporter type 1-like isoform X2 [Lepeophtheirus salmonis]
MDHRTTNTSMEGDDDLSEGDLSNDEESFHEHENSRTHSVCQNSSNCMNIYSHYNDPPSELDHTHIRRSASGVFRCTGDLDRSSYHDEPLLLENGCHIVYSPHLLLENEMGSTPDAFEGSRLQKQMKLMNKSLNSKLEELNGFSSSMETNVALTEIRSQLHELTKSVESCQSEVYDVKKDVVGMKHEIDSVQFVKDEIDDLRDSLDRLEADGERKKTRLIDQGLTFFLGYSIFAAVLGMLQFGYNTGVINAPETVIEKFIRFAYRQRYDGQNMTYEASTFLYAIAVAIFALGGMCGGFMGGMIANKLGRKGGLLFNNFIGVFGACSMGSAKFAESYELLIVGRFLIGVNCGLNTSLVPMYISEIAPLNLRGGLGTVNQLAVTVGLLISQILGVEGLLGTDDNWPFLLGIAIFPSILQIVLLPFCPESPRYLLITKQQEAEARSALKKLRNSIDIEDDIAEMRAEEQAQHAEAKITMFELLRSPTLRLPLLIAIVMQLSQQLSGINAVFYYSTNLFITTGLTETHAKYATIGIGSVMVIMTLISIPLMDRSGRRTLHLYGLGGMFIFSIFITISFLVKELVAWIWWLSVISTLFYVVFFAVGPGSIPWMITAELFSQGPRPAAMSVAVLINWCANFLVGIGFPTMQTALENYTFLPFSVFLAIFWVFTYRKVPETKNKTFDEIATLFRIGHKQRTLMNCVNNISQMNSMMCEHASLINHDKVDDKVPKYQESQDSKEYPLLVPDSCLSSSESGETAGSTTPTSEYSQRENHTANHLISPDNSETPTSNEILDHTSPSIYIRSYSECNSKHNPNS